MTPFQILGIVLCACCGLAGIACLFVSLPEERRRELWKQPRHVRVVERTPYDWEEEG